MAMEQQELRLLPRADETVDWLPEHRMQILQKKKGFRFGTDAVALAAWASGIRSRRTADLGTGTGIVSMLLAAGTETPRFDAFEIQPQMADMADRSIRGNSLEGRIHIYNEDMRNAAARIGHGSCDLVVANPPYFRRGGGLISETDGKLHSRHERECPLEEWVAAGARLLRSRGSFCLVHHPERLADLVCLMRAYRVEVKVLQMLQARSDLPPSAVLVRGVRDGKPGLRILQPYLPPQGSIGLPARGAFGIPNAGEFQCSSAGEFQCSSAVGFRCSYAVGFRQYCAGRFSQERGKEASMAIRLTPPLDAETIRSLKAGDEVLITGTIYAARDAAHKRLVSMLDAGEEWPFSPEGQIIYYVGPCPTPPGKTIGSAGPTTSGRMDAYAPTFIEKGLRGMIGKGNRTEAVVAAMKRHGAVYFHAIGGAGALIASRIVREETVAFPELGPEALRRLEVEDFQAFVVIDAEGRDMYAEGRERYRLAD